MAATDDLVTVLTDPESFFEGRTDPALLPPVVLVAVVVLVNLLGSVPALLVTFRALPADVRVFALLFSVLFLLIGAVVPFVAWLVYAGVFYGVSALLGGEGSFRDTFVLSGWGFAPAVLGGAVGAVAAVVAAGSVTVPPGAGAEVGQAVGQQVGRHPAVLASSVLGLGFTLWQGYVWTYAVGQARNLSTREAVVSVSVPVLLSLALGLFGLASNLLG